MLGHYAVAPDKRDTQLRHRIRYTVFSSRNTSYRSLWVLSNSELHGAPASLNQAQCIAVRAYVMPPLRARSVMASV
jgi:hypothetical protein